MACFHLKIDYDSYIGVICIKFRAYNTYLESNQTIWNAKTYNQPE